jgi:hypothetical protein
MLPLLYCNFYHVPIPPPPPLQSQVMDRVSTQLKRCWTCITHGPPPPSSQSLPSRFSFVSRFVCAVVYALHMQCRSVDSILMTAYYSPLTCTPLMYPPYFLKTQVTARVSTQLKRCWTFTVSRRRLGDSWCVILSQCCMYSSLIRQNLGSHHCFRVPVSLCVSCALHVWETHFAIICCLQMDDRAIQHLT